MSDTAAIYTVAYILISVCLVAPPTEFVSLGLTVQNVLSGYLGSEDLNFIYYHIKRTTATLIFHSLLPLGYYIGLLLLSDKHTNLADCLPWKLDIYWQLSLASCIIIHLAAVTLALYWHRKKWSNHPIARTLKYHAPSGSTWMAMASSINVEFRRIDKFTTGVLGRRIIVTDSWIMKTAAYYVHIAHQQDIHLTLTGTEEHDLSHESYHGVQYLNITVTSINSHVNPFVIRLNATEYSDLKEKLHSPIRMARDVVIKQSLSDRFLDAFKKQVDENDVFVKPPDMELEPCIGCMQVTANVKLVKLCDDLTEGDCVPCYCRPMWCRECMGKWFASRQDQSAPENWMSGKSPCPTCRARFCMLDICKIV